MLTCRASFATILCTYPYRNLKLANRSRVHSFRQLEKTMRAHQKCVNCLHFSRGGLVTGGKDGLVKLWSKQLAHLKTFDLNEVSSRQRSLSEARILSNIRILGQLRDWCNTGDEDPAKRPSRYRCETKLLKPIER